MSESRNYGISRVLISATVSAAFVTAALWLTIWVMAPLEESDAGWNCFAHGNRICGEPSSEALAWAAFDGPTGDASLDTLAEVVDVNRPYRVDYVGVSILRPELGHNLLAVHWEDGRWYVFRAVNTDN